MASAMVCCNRFHSSCHTTDRFQGNSMPTPSNHRTQLGPAVSNSSRLGAGGFRNTTSTTNRGLQNQTPAHQQPLASLNANTLSRPSMSGYGLSAGLKVGKQSSWSLLRFTPDVQPSSFNLTKIQQVQFEVNSAKAAIISVSLDNFKVMVVVIDALQQEYFLTISSLCF